MRDIKMLNMSLLVVSEEFPGGRSISPIPFALLPCAHFLRYVPSYTVVHCEILAICTTTIHEL